MVRALAIAYLLAAALGRASAAPAPAPARAPAAAPTFAVVVPCEGGAERCLAGKHAEGAEVVLVSPDATCALETGKPTTWRPPSAEANDPAEPATALVGTCKGSFVLAAVGAPPATFARVERKPVTSPVLMEGLLRRIDAENALARAFEEAKASGEPTGMGDLADESPSESFTLAGVAASPTFVRFPLKGGSGPVLVVEAGRVGTPFHLCSGPLVPFRLAGRVFVHAWSGRCSTGARGEIVLELDGGKLREVFAGFDLAD